MSQDYKATLFLPQTQFPMRGHLPQMEPGLLAYWDAIGLYDQKREVRRDKPQFILHDGPPYANGNLHVGHALNKILKDIVNRSRFLMGMDTPFIQGWDCHGLPIEAKIEEAYREKGQNKDDVPVLEFRDECRAFATKWIDVQRGQFKRLGVLADPKNHYTTMTLEAEATIVEMLGAFLLSGNLYRGIRPVMWSVVEKTALAEAEVEYQDHTSHAIFVKFPLVDCLEHSSILIWTTTPWSLPGNRAVSYGVDIDYVLIHVSASSSDLIKAGEKFFIAQELLEKVCETLGITEHTTLKTLKGLALEGLRCRHPLYGKGYDFDVPLLPADHVTTDAGSGFVHTAPGHGVEDFLVGKIFHLEVPETVDDDGTFYKHIPLFAGKHVYKVNPDIVEALTLSHTLAHHTKITHSYPHSWRSKTPLIYRTTPQWFIRMDVDGLRDKALAAIDDVAWYPQTGKNRITAMIAGRPDWCISRQRTWGVPIMIFVHKETGEPLRDPVVMARIVEAVKAEGSDTWLTSSPERFLAPNYDPSDYTAMKDILDVWFDSGSSHAFTLKNNPDLHWPADLYLEGSDQHRGWFQTSMLVSCGVFDKAPYRQVLTHGYVVDDAGKKLSKSRGDAVSPQTITDKMGADILRLWVSSIDYGDDVRVGPELLKRQEDIYRRYRNTLRYLLGALQDKETVPHVAPDTLELPERWIMHRLVDINRLFTKAMTSYQFQDFYQHLHSFCASDLSAFYFDMRKDTLYCDASDSPKRAGTLWVMDQVFESLCRWLAPVLVFTSEEAFRTRHTQEGSSIHLQDMPAISDHFYDEALGEKIEAVRHLRQVMTGAIEKERAEKRLGSSLQATMHITIDAGHEAALAGVDLAELCIASHATLSVGAHAPGAFASKDVPGISVTVTLAQGEKCQRCWKMLPEVVEVCKRCAAAAHA